MPYNNINDLPIKIKSHLPIKAQEIYLNAFNNHYIKYLNIKNIRELESESSRIGWMAVKKKYIKNSNTGQWQQIKNENY